MPNEQKVTRKLRAILSADVKGYSVLMADDEAATVHTINSYREVMTDLIHRHNGRVVDAKGDNVLAGFPSVVDAVQCAVDIQKQLALRNADLPEERKMKFRIGVNLGDVIEEEETLYGDGVNVAARLEGLADPGGVSISGTAFDQVRDKLDLGYKYLGEVSVKNIPRPIRAYNVLMGPEHAGKLINKKRSIPGHWRWAAVAGVLTLFVFAGSFAIWSYYFRHPAIEPASKEKMAYPLPDKPSIAVLPFDNMSGDPNQDYFSDGLSEQIIATLSKISDLFVISRNSTFRYKGKPIKIQTVAEELGVRYVLEGSVQKTEDRVRITAQLIDAINGTHVWAERYDTELKNIFDLQDELTKKIISSLHIKLTYGEDARLLSRYTNNLEAYLKVLEGHKHLMRLNKDDNTLARQLYEESIALDANYVTAYVELAWTYLFDNMYGWNTSRIKSLEAAYEIAQKALSLDESFAGIYATLGSIHLQKEEMKEALALRQKAVALEPNSANYHGLLGTTYLFMRDRTDEAIAELKNANRLDPFPPNWILHYLGTAYRVNGEYDKAIEVFKKAIKNDPNYWISHLGLSACYGLLGQKEEARAAAMEVLRIDPNFSIGKMKTSFRNKADKDRTLEVLRKAGLPYSPPSPLPDKPSIAVLPFTNMSNDPDQEYFSDGMTDELIGDLAKIKDILVISRNSAFTYKGKSQKVQQIAQELNVRYILEGSVQRSGNKVRIRAQLIDGKTDHHVWSESYDGVMDDIFDLQDKITEKIVSALSVTLTPDEQDRITDKGTESIPAYDAYLKGFEHYSRMTGDNLLKAINYYREAVKIDPKFSRAYSGLAAAYYMSTSFNYPWESEPKILWDILIFKIKARHYLNLALKDPTWEAYVVAAYMDVARKRFDEALSSAEKALLMAPNEHLANIAMGQVLNCVGRADEALKYIDVAMRLDPRFLDILLVEKGKALFLLGDYEKAVGSIQRGLTLNPALTNFSSFEAASYAFLGKIKESEKAWHRFVDGFPVKNHLTTSYLYDFYPFKEHKVFDHFIDGLKMAGFEGNPSDYYKVDKKNRLSGHKIKELLFGKTAIGYNPAAAELYYRWTATGDVEFRWPRMHILEKGKSRIEGDSICHQYEYLYDGIKACIDIYYINEENNDSKYKYLYISESALSTLSIEE